MKGKKVNELLSIERAVKYKKISKVATTVAISCFLFYWIKESVISGKLNQVGYFEHITKELEYMKDKQGYQDFIDDEHLDAYYKMLEGKITNEEFEKINQNLYSNQNFERYLRTIEDPEIKEIIAQSDKRKAEYLDVQAKRVRLGGVAFAGMVGGQIVRMIFDRKKDKEYKKFASETIGEEAEV